MRKLATGDRIAKQLIGRTIVAVEMRPFDSGPQGTPRTQFDPIFHLDNGDAVFFHVTETDGLGEYGVEPVLRKKGTKSTLHSRKTD